MAANLAFAISGGELIEFCCGSFPSARSDEKDLCLRRVPELVVALCADLLSEPCCVALLCFLRALDLCVWPSTLRSFRLIATAASEAVLAASSEGRRSPSERRRHHGEVQEEELSPSTSELMAFVLLAVMLVILTAGKRVRSKRPACDHQQNRAAFFGSDEIRRREPRLILNECMQYSPVLSKWLT